MFFEIFDKDHDGYLNGSELADLSKAMKGPSVTVLLQFFDKDKDGRLSFEEFLPLLAEMSANTNITPATHDDELREAFKVFDQDGDGVISAAELQTVFFRLGDGITLTEAEYLIRQVDTTGDGKVGFDEFEKLYSLFLDRDE